MPSTDIDDELIELCARLPADHPAVALIVEALAVPTKEPLPIPPEFSPSVRAQLAAMQAQEAAHRAEILATKKRLRLRLMTLLAVPSNQATVQ